jgi:hypothetical protein
MKAQYLGYKVGRNGLEVDESKIEAVLKAVPPTTKTGLRRFLGMTGYSRRFIDQYSSIASPLNKYLRGDQQDTFELNTEALQAHTILKNAINSAHVLAFPRKTGKYVIEADASASQLAAQLLQEQEDQTYRPIGFWSRPSTAAERNYSSTEREALAIVWSVKLCRPYL